MKALYNGTLEEDEESYEGNSDDEVESGELLVIDGENWWEYLDEDDDDLSDEEVSGNPTEESKGEKRKHLTDDDGPPRKL